MIRSLPFNIGSIHNAYADGLLPMDVIDEALRRIDAAGDPGIFLLLEEPEELEIAVSDLGKFDPVAKPLWGIPFAIKDNIDAAKRVTTAACPAFAYEAERDAFCVATLREAGAILVGKTNLDQFATGLVGLRTPYPPPRNAIDIELAPGGSSSGSAVAVSLGLVSFALGTDTAGSGRVPAAFNNIVGLKPSLGTISATGVVPACRSLDTVSIFACTVEDAHSVFRIATVFDPGDAYAKNITTSQMTSIPPVVRIGVPATGQREFFGDAYQSRNFEAALSKLVDLGGEIVELDFTPFHAVAEMLYEGAWVAERYTVVEDLLKSAPDAIDPVTRQVIGRADKLTAADAFRAMYRLEGLKREIAPIVEGLDAICVPSVPCFYTVAEVDADPVGTNSRLGVYTNFVNLLDFCGIAVPVMKRKDGKPGSVTLLAPSGSDGLIAGIAAALHASSEVCQGGTDWPLPSAKPDRIGLCESEIELAVVGAHMSGLPLNGELTRLGARFLRATRTAPCYRLFALAGGPPARPGLVRDDQGDCIEIETWALPKPQFGDFIDGVPAPLGIGTLSLETGEQVKGFVCETSGLDGATDITRHGGWRKYIVTL